jgi:hypothetical protein
MASVIEKQHESYDNDNTKSDVERRASVARTEKGRWERLWPVIACGAGLFSDGYLNNVRLPYATTPQSEQTSKATTLPTATTTRKLGIVC